MVKSIQFANRLIGPEASCFIIAEAGVNHNGDLELAKQLVDVAKEAGADAVKFQTWITEALVTSEAQLAKYQEKNIGESVSQFDMLKALELSQNSFREIQAYADKKDILFFSTPDEEDSADFLEKLDVPLFKIGSGELTNLPYLRHVASKMKPIILSTGMSTLGEIEKAVRVIEDTGNVNLILLHCVSNYPSAPSESNLRAMDTMVTAFGYPVGFSDHTLGIHIPIAAVARGAAVIEKHFTLDNEMTGPDHIASLNPTELMEMVQAIRQVESALGDGIKRPVLSELSTKKVVQKSLVAQSALQVGDEITKQTIALRRSSGGLSYDYLPLILGRRLTVDVLESQPLTLDMFS